MEKNKGTSELLQALVDHSMEAIQEFREKEEEEDSGSGSDSSDDESPSSPGTIKCIISLNFTIIYLLVNIVFIRTDIY